MIFLITRVEDSTIPKIASLENNKKYIITVRIEGEETNHKLRLLSIDDDTEQIRFFLENLDIQGVVPENVILSSEERQKLTNWKNTYETILSETDEEEKNRQLNQFRNDILPEIEEILQKATQEIENLEKINLNPYLSEEVKVYAKNLQAEIESETGSEQDIRNKKSILGWISNFPNIKKQSLINNNYLQLSEKKSLFFEKMEGFIGQQGLKETFFQNLASQNENSLPTFLFTGPSGTGKTQFAKKIANALEVPLIKINCSLLSNSDQIIGVPGNLVGSMPGLIYQSLVSGKSINPIILLDEIEKIPNKEGRNLSEIFLPFFDRPNENLAIEDKFLNTKFDFSKVLFICSSNDQQRIPQPLLSRMKVIEFKGYTKEEKLNILVSI